MKLPVEAGLSTLESSTFLMEFGIIAQGIYTLSDDG